MSVRTFLIGSLFTAISSWAIWIIIINFLDPIQAGFIGLFLFYLAIFLSVASTSALIGYGVRRLLKPDLLAAHVVGPAMRQGVLLGIFLDVLLVLQHMRLYRWWVGISFAIILIIIEIVFLSYDRIISRASSNTEK